MARNLQQGQIRGSKVTYRRWGRKKSASRAIRAAPFGPTTGNLAPRGRSTLTLLGGLRPLFGRERCRPLVRHALVGRDRRPSLGQKGLGVLSYAVSTAAGHS